MASPNAFLCAKSNGRNVRITMHLSGDALVVHGATIPMSVTPGSAVQDVMLALPPDQEEGIVGVSFRRITAGSKHTEAGALWAHYFLSISAAGPDDLVFVNLEHAWVPGGKLLGQLRSGGLDVHDTESGDTFTTSEREAQEHGWRIVRDPNLLLRYLHGSATREEVLAASMQYLGDQGEIAKLKAELESVRNQSRNQSRVYEEMVRGAREASGALSYALRHGWLPPRPSVWGAYRRLDDALHPDRIRPADADGSR